MCQYYVLQAPAPPGVLRDLKRVTTLLWLPLGAALDTRTGSTGPSNQMNLLHQERKHPRKCRKEWNYKFLLFRKSMLSLVCGMRFTDNKREAELPQRVGHCIQAWFTGKVQALGLCHRVQFRPCTSQWRLGTQPFGISAPSSVNWDHSSSLTALLGGLNKTLHWKHQVASIVAPPHPTPPHPHPRRAPRLTQGSPSPSLGGMTCTSSSLSHRYSCS